MTRRTRRSALGLILGAGTAALAGCSDLIELPTPGGTASEAYCVPRGDLVRRQRMGSASLAYEENGTEQAFSLDSGFADQLDAWLDFFNDTSGLPTIDRIVTYGTWIDGTGSDNCSSWHNSGRAFDFTRLISDGEQLVSCRNDLWREEDDLAQERRRYWALAASLHRHFSFVVTYVYNDAHRNHIHVDNGASGSDLASFDSGSRTQVQAVQAICTYLFGIEVAITSSWDRATRDATEQILADLGRGGDLTDDGAWTALMGAASSRGG